MFIVVIGIVMTVMRSQLASAADVTYTNPVMAGDYPDPSVIRVGDDYYATATSSEWGPQFPLLHSTDLVNWEIVGPVLKQRPSWAAGNFWAPEISFWNGHYFVYYTARKKDGPLAVAVATADRPEGPYTDHGPLVAQDDGSIDADPVTDETGERWLVWKEDGNSRRQPTPIWAQQLDETGTKLIGEKHELIRNDEPWEGGLVEGPFILKRGDYFYLFYSGNGCCGRGCTYAMGVARSKALLGPWEKNPANPIMTGTEQVKCPGHGSIVTDPQGRYWLLHHAYDAKTFTFTGREMWLEEVKFGADDWPTINDGNGPAITAPSPFGAKQKHAELSFDDDFASGDLRPGWQWPQNNMPIIALKGGVLELTPQPERATDTAGAIVARSTTSGDYTATTLVTVRDLRPGVTVGLAAIGDPGNAIGVGITESKAIVWQRQRDEQKTLAELPKVDWAKVYLQIRVANGNRFLFSVSRDGKDWQPVGDQADGGYLPPWDRSIRIGLTAGGAADATGKFDFLRIEPSKSRF